MRIEKQRIARTAIVGACAIVVALALAWFFYVATAPLREDYKGHLIDTVGEIRDQKLDELTARYVAENPQGQVLVVEGDRIAPLPYLNRELRDMDASWRVKIVDDRIGFREVT